MADQGMRSSSGSMIAISGSAPGSPLDEIDHFGVAVRRQPALIGLGVVDGGGEADAAQPAARDAAAGRATGEEVAALAGGKAWISSTTTVLEVSKSSALSSWLSSRLSDSGVVSSICGGFTRWRCLRRGRVAGAGLDADRQAHLARSG